MHALDVSVSLLIYARKRWLCVDRYMNVCYVFVISMLSMIFSAFKFVTSPVLWFDLIHFYECEREKLHSSHAVVFHLNIEFDVRHSTNQNTSIKFNQKKRKHVSCLVIRSRSHIIDQTRKSRKIHFFLLHSHLKIAVDLFHLKVGRGKRQLIKNEKRWMFWYVCQSVFIFAVYWSRYDIIFREIELVHCDTDFCHLLSFSNRFLLICTSGLFPFMWHSWTACNMDSVLKVTTQLTRSILFFIFALSRIRHFNSLMNIFI